MKKVVLFLALALFIVLTLVFGFFGGDVIREGAIDGWLWWLSCMFGLAIAITCFFSLHSAMVTKAASRYPFTGDTLSFSNLILLPAMAGFIAHLFCVFWIFLIVYLFAYDKDFKTMNKESIYNLGNPFNFAVLAISTGLVVVIPLVLFGHYISKRGGER